jgi:hypothetical protein
MGCSILSRESFMNLEKKNRERESTRPFFTNLLYHSLQEKWISFSQSGRVALLSFMLQISLVDGGCSS